MSMRCSIELAQSAPAHKSILKWFPRITCIKIERVAHQPSISPHCERLEEILWHTNAHSIEVYKHKKIKYRSLTRCSDSKARFQQANNLSNALWIDYASILMRFVLTHWLLIKWLKLDFDPFIPFALNGISNLLWQTFDELPNIIKIKCVANAVCSGVCVDDSKQPSITGLASVYRATGSLVSFSHQPQYFSYTWKPQRERRPPPKMLYQHVS